MPVTGNELPEWIQSMDAAITVCDDHGIILYMNHKSAMNFQKHGGFGLLGQSLFDCHPEPASNRLRDLLKSGKANQYTIESSGRRKLICQTPWFRDGCFAGLVELTVDLADEHLVHHVRS